MFTKMKHWSIHNHFGIYILLVIMSVLFMYYLHSYMILYLKDQKERKEIQQMECNLFPSILTGLHVPYQKMELYIVDAVPESIMKSKLSDNSSNYKKSWKGDCILSIPEIELEKIVYTGTERLDYLKEYGLATASDNMQYANGGNYIICGHASRLYGHSLNRIKEIQKGTLIYIKTPDGKDEYIVDNVTFENMYETSKYCNQTPEQRVTIISCAKYISKESYIVIQAVPN